MRCFVCSDIHMATGRLERLLLKAGKPVDAVLFAGDLTNLGSRADAKAVLSYFGNIPIYTIPGNMDTVEVMAVFEEQTERVHAAHHGLGDWHVVGFGGGSPDNPGDMLFSDAEITEQLLPLLKAAPAAQTILLTHQPPYNTTLDKIAGKASYGSKAVRALIDRFQPAFHFCGHIHESWNEDLLGTTRSYNVAAVKEGRAGVLDLSTGVFTRFIV